MRYTNPVKVFAACSVLALTSLPVLAQMTDQSPAPSVTEAARNRVDRQNQQPDYSWVGLLGLLGLAGLLKKSREERDRAPISAGPASSH